jgi:predicted CXXCH cytochrome family protein
MEILLRYLRQSSSGATEFLDSSVTADVITVGSAADSTVQLLGRSVAGKHAEIRKSGSGLRIVCRRGNRVEVNGQRCASKRLIVGDKISLAGHGLAVIQPPAGFDVAVEVRPDTGVGASEFEAAFVTDLDRTWLSKRKTSWLLFIVILAAGLVIPLWLIPLHREGRPTPPMLPDDGSWSSGPLSAVHALAAGNRCEACHQQLFIHVQDRACVECHKTTQDHVTTERRALTSLGVGQRCGECHVEHLGADARLTIQDDGLCVGCHSESDKTFGSLKVLQASGFEPKQHPAFSVALQKLSGPPGTELADLQWTAYRVPLAGATEQSNLKFSHSQHLDARKVTRLSGGSGLGCADCHILGADGAHFQPVTMPKTCAGCHTLNFDPSAPSRQLPHGKPLDAMLMIEDYFARKFSDPAPAPTRKQERRVPDLDRDPSSQMEVDICTGSTVVCARQRASREIEKQFNGSGCVSCHVVVDSKDADLHDRFQVTPVRLGYDYFPEARFPHKAHEIQGKLTGDAACEFCHASRKSEHSTDLLLPNVDLCLQCHRDRTAADIMPAKLVNSASGSPSSDAAPQKIVSLQCISCHAYHPKALWQGPRLTEK